MKRPVSAGKRETARDPVMPAPIAALVKLRQICASLPDTKETLTWGEPHFRVGDKIFAGYGDQDGRPTIDFKLEMAHAAAVIKIPGFEKAPYVGHKGWVSMDASRIKDWEMVREMIYESYGLIAPKKSLAKLSNDSPSVPARNVAARKVAARKVVARKVVARKTATTKTATTKTAANRRTTKKKHK